MLKKEKFFEIGSRGESIYASVDRYLYILLFFIFKAGLRITFHNLRIWIRMKHAQKVSDPDPEVQNATF